MKDYNLEFSMYYINTDNFKQKTAEILISVISNSRLFEQMQFSSYAHIEFEKDDKVHRFAKVIEFDKFNRSKTNCLIFDLKRTSFNNGEYDKCFVYRSNNYKESTYGFCFLNTETGKNNHIFNIDETPDELCHKITQTLHTLYNKPIYDYYAKQYDAVKGRNGLSAKDVPVVTDYNKLMEDMEKRYKLAI